MRIRSGPLGLSSSSSQDDVVSQSLSNQKERVIIPVDFTNRILLTKFHRVKIVQIFVHVLSHCYLILRIIFDKVKAFLHFFNLFFEFFIFPIFFVNWVYILFRAFLCFDTQFTPTINLFFNGVLRTIIYQLV